MPFIEFISEDDARDVNGGHDAVGRIYEAARSRAGDVANIIKTMSRDVRSLQASMGFYISLMKADNALSAARREMLAAVVSNVNACYY